MANILLSSGLEAAQMAYTQRCRAEDMTHRKIENQRRLIDNARRKVRVLATRVFIGWRARSCAAGCHGRAAVGGLDSGLMVRVVVLSVNPCRLTRRYHSSKPSHTSRP